MKLTTAIAAASLGLMAGGAGAADLNPYLPNAKLTPGATNPAITQDNIRETICNNHGGHWTTKQIRPPSSYTNPLKKKQIVEYGHGDTMKDCEEDHLIPLTVGGNPRDPHNLWPEPWNGPYGAHVKDKLEVALNKAVCSGKLTLEEAQKAIATDWIAAYEKYVGSGKKKRVAANRSSVQCQANSRL
jgi:hypothetical protein